MMTETCNNWSAWPEELGDAAFIHAISPAMRRPKKWVATVAQPGAKIYQRHTDVMIKGQIWGSSVWRRRDPQDNGMV